MSERTDARRAGLAAARLALDEIEDLAMHPDGRSANEVVTAIARKARAALSGRNDVMPRESAWHEGHVMGGYQNDACATCQGERRRELRDRLAALPYSRRWPNAKGKGEMYVRVDDAVDAILCVATKSRLDPTLPPDPDNYRELAASFWVHYRCGMVGCRTVEPHEHGGGQPGRVMTAAERAEAAR